MRYLWLQLGWIESFWSDYDGGDEQFSPKEKHGDIDCEDLTDRVSLANRKTLRILFKFASKENFSS